MSVPGASASADSGPVGSDGMRPGVFPSTRVDPPSGAPRPDGPAATPDNELTAAELSGLVRLPASEPAAAGSCTPDDLDLRLVGFDAAAGHRYSQIRATNIAAEECTLRGWPGLGFRGANGTAFALVAEHNATASDRVNAVPHDPAEPVVLKPGGASTADIEWTGALAGAYDEHVSLIALQLATDGPAGSIIIPEDEPVDIGEGTTVRIRRWAPAAPPAS